MRLLVFTAQWCGPCKFQKKEIEKFKALDPEKASVIEIVDVDDPTVLLWTQALAIQSIPTLVLLDDRTEAVKKHVGVVPADKLGEFMTLPEESKS